VFSPLLQGIAFKHAKKKKGMMIGFITFEDEEQLKSSSKVFSMTVIHLLRVFTGNWQLMVYSFQFLGFRGKNNWQQNGKGC